MLSAQSGVTLIQPFKVCQQLYVPPGLKFKNSTLWLHSV